MAVTVTKLRKSARKRMLVSHERRSERARGMKPDQFLKTMSYWCVSYAKIIGWLPDISGLSCADCGKQATCWDHRDYTRPLDVDPVCRTCNRRRGKANTRTNWLEIEGARRAKEAR